MNRLIRKIINNYFARKADETYFEHLRTQRLDIIRSHNIIIDDTVVMPPWIKYPEYEMYGICWNMKKPKDYLKKIFIPYWKSLSDEDKVKYTMRYYIDTEWATMWIHKLFALESITNPGRNS